MRSSPTNICRPETDLNRIKRGCETGLHQLVQRLSRRRRAGIEIFFDRPRRCSSGTTRRQTPEDFPDKKAMQEHESAIGTMLIPTPPQPIECGNPASSSNRFAIVGCCTACDGTGGRLTIMLSCSLLACSIKRMFPLRRPT